MKPTIRFLAAIAAAGTVLSIGTILVFAQMPAPTSLGPSTTFTTPPTPTSPEPDAAVTVATTPPPRRPISTVSVPTTLASPPPRPGCPAAGEVPGVLHVVFAPGTSAGERAAAHAAAGGTPGERSPQEIPADGGAIAVTVGVPPGRERAAITAYESRPSVRSAMPVVISPPRCPPTPIVTGPPPPPSPATSPPPTTASPTSSP
jgi:hypothetical protein